MESNQSIESSQSLFQLNQERLELLELRKQRKKVELLAEELNSLENMYTIKVEENLELKTCLKQLKSLVELFEAEKNDLQQNLDMTREKLSNYIAESQRMYHQKQQIKAAWEREKVKYQQNQRVLSTKTQKLQDSLEQFQTKFTRKDRQATRISSVNMAHQQSLKTLTDKILLLTQEIENKDINMIRLNGELKIERDQNQSLKERLRVSNESVRQLNQKVRQVEVMRDRTTQLLQEQMKMMEQEHSGVVEALSREISENNYIVNAKVEGKGKKRQYVDSVKNEINALKSREIQRIDSLIHNKIIRGKEGLEFY